MALAPSSPCWRCRRGEHLGVDEALLGASKPIEISGRSRLTASTACSTPLPPYDPWRRRRGMPQRPRGAGRCAAGNGRSPMVPPSRPTSTSTVGLPRESRISRAMIALDDGHGELLVRVVDVYQCASLTNASDSRADAAPNFTRPRSPPFGHRRHFGAMPRQTASRPLGSARGGGARHTATLMSPAPPVAVTDTTGGQPSSARTEMRRPAPS